MLVDSHCHLNDARLKDDVETVLKAAKESGVEHMVTISTKLAEVPDLEALSTTHPMISHTVGVHPHDVDETGVPTLKDLTDKLAHPQAVGIGETGLDYYYDHSHRPNQKDSFRVHINAMKETGLPLIIHSRDAEEDILSILKEERAKDTEAPGLIHCFSGTRRFAEETLAMGFYISFSGILTFKNAEDIRNTAKMIPEDRLLVETDAPYLAPVPHRGKRNEPSFVRHTAETLAAIRNTTLTHIAQITTNNFYRLFTKVNRP